MPRQPNGRTSINKGADGLYHTWVTIGTYPSGRPRRKHIKRRTAGEVVTALEELNARLKKGQDVTIKADTYGEWLQHWINNVILTQVRMRKKKHNTYTDYEKIVRVHLVPQLGGYRLMGRKNRLEPEHFEEMYAQLAEAGKAGSYIRKMHYVAQRSLKEAYRRGKADRIVTDLIDPPEYDAEDVEPLSLAEARAVLTEALTNHDGLAARWALGVLQGSRQGEALGLRWPQLVLDPDSQDDVAHLVGGQQLQRRKWLHGCGDPAACNRGAGRRDGKSPCKTRWCPPMYTHGCDDPKRCKKLAHFCPARQAVPDKCARHARRTYCRPCPPDCADHASTCPKRTGGGLVEEDLKTKKSKAPTALADVVVELLRRHREEQIRVLAAHGLEFDPAGYVFIDVALLRQGNAQSVKPINPRKDWGNWRAMQLRAGLKRKDLKRLHAARHSAATYLRATGSDLKMVADVLRQANLKTAANYSDSVMTAMRDALNTMAAALVDGDLTKIVGARKGALQ